MVKKERYEDIYGYGIEDDTRYEDIYYRWAAGEKSTIWTEIDHWITNDIYLNPRFKQFLANGLKNTSMDYIPQLRSDKSCGV